MALELVAEVADHAAQGIRGKDLVEVTALTLAVVVALAVLAVEDLAVLAAQGLPRLLTGPRPFTVRAVVGQTHP